METQGIVPVSPYCIIAFPQTSLVVREIIKLKIKKLITSIIYVWNCRIYR